MNTTRFASHIVAAALAGAAIMAHAGIKYWDNPEFKVFDVGDYAAQESLVLNYDGIRNAGAAADHDASATTWVNLGTGGSDYDMVRKGAPTLSCWTDTGYYFEGKTWFVATNKFSVPNAYEIESLISAEHAKQTDIGYVFFLSTIYPRASSNDGWRWGSFGIRKAGTTYNQSIDGTQYNGTLNLNTDGAGAGTVKRPVLLDESFGYLTAVANRTYASIFTGLQEPTGAPGRSGLASGKTELSGNSLHPYLGGHDGTGGETTCAEGIVGTIRNFRYYSTPLSYEQRAWNRVVDNARYFGATSAALPVTNAVITANYEYASGDTPNGTYAVDSEGYTFTAPASKGFQGRAFTLTGYTVERWDAAGGTWGAAEQHAATANGASVAVSASDCVRITWLWDAPASARTYSFSDYVTDGLLLFYDGILNQGVDKPHDSTATTWVNIGNGDGTQDCTLSLNRKRSTAGDAGAWGADGYNFKGYSEFKKEFSIPHPTTHSIQALVDADKNDQIYTISYAYATAYDYSSFILSKTGTPPVANSLCWCAGGGTAPKRPYVQHSDGKYSYATAIMDGTAKTQAFTEGTTIPSSGSLANGFYQSETNFPNFTASRIFLGGYNGASGANDAYLLVGKVKFLRYYPNKKLTEAELAQNRKVDDYRYFGKLPPITTTNVVVQSTYSYLQGNEPAGAYETGSSHTFTAPATVTAANGISYACDGYTVETWNGSEWAGATVGSGNSYAYATSAGTVRLTWRWRPVSGLRTAADYSLDDLAPGALLHYDGLLNQGVDAERSTTATTWANLGTLGAAGDISRTTVGSAGVGAWTDDGYGFVGGSKFVTSHQLVWTKSLTIQVLLDAAYTDNTATGDGNYVFSTGWNKAAMVLRGGDATKTMWFHTQSLAHNDMPRIANADSSKFTFGTAIADANAKTAVVFTGTEAPTNGTIQTGYLSRSSMADAFSNNLAVGGWGGGENQYLRGTIKSFRYYDRVLTEEELVRNRNVDASRYFNALGVTNLVVEVEAGVDFNATPAPGAYFVEGSYELAAAPGTDTPTRYKLQDWNEASGKWDNARYVNGTAFTYEAADATAAKMKLTWCKTKAFMLILR